MLQLRENLVDEKSEVTRMTLFIASLDSKRGADWKEQLYSVWLSPNLPQDAEQNNVLEWEGLIRMQLSRDQFRSI